MNEEELKAREEELKKKEEELAKALEAAKALAGKSDDERMEALLKERMDAALKDFKSKLNVLHEDRDEALKKLKEFEQKEREAEIKRLAEEGKHKEAFDLQLAELRAENEVLKKRNVELTRDIELKSELAKYEFKTDRARNAAFKEISEELVKDDKDVWRHKNGKNIGDFVKEFSETEDNSYLFVVKISSGSGDESKRKAADGGGEKKVKSLFDLPQEEVVKMAQEGKFKKK